MSRLKRFFKDAMRKRVQVTVISGGHVLTDEPTLKRIVKNIVLISTDTTGDVEVSLGGKHSKTFKFGKISWEQSGERSGGKAAAGAIIGTIAAGPLGTIAGAAIGGRKKDTSSAFLYLTDDSGEEHEIHIECTKEQYEEISRLPWG